MDRPAEWYSGTVRHEAPLAWRRFRHRTTGEEAMLTVAIAHPPGGPFHAVIAARPDRGNIPGVQWGTFCKDHEQAREVWSARERELRAAGTSGPRSVSNQTALLNCLHVLRNFRNMSWQRHGPLLPERMGDMRHATSHDVAKAFGKYQDEALAEEAVTVTRYGRPTVVILSYAEYERLLAGQPARRREARQAADMPDELVADLDRVIEDTERRFAERGGDDGPAAA